MKKPIPETDAAWGAYLHHPNSEEGDPWGLAARLERQRDKLRRERDKLRHECMEAAATEIERLREALREIRSISNGCQDSWDMLAKIEAAADEALTANADVEPPSERKAND